MFKVSLSLAIAALRRYGIVKEYGATASAPFESQTTKAVRKTSTPPRRWQLRRVRRYQNKIANGKNTARGKPDYICFFFSYMFSFLFFIIAAFVMRDSVSQFNVPSYKNSRSHSALYPPPQKKKKKNERKKESKRFSLLSGFMKWLCKSCLASACSW